MEGLTEFEEKVKELDRDIISHYEPFEVEEERKIITDGVVDEQEYYKSGVKILWILKEAYDKDNDGECRWSLSKKIGMDDFLKDVGGVKTTWYPIIYATYGILHGFMSYEDMDDIEKRPEMDHILRKIAFMNVQKFPAGTTTNNSDIQKAYKEHSEILLQQIATYKPDIIIGGNTLSYFIQDLGLTDAHKDYDENYFWIKDNQLFIHAGHPSQRGSAEDKENYVDDIVRVAKKFYQKENK